MTVARVSNTPAAAAMIDKLRAVESAEVLDPVAQQVGKTVRGVLSGGPLVIRASIRRSRSWRSGWS